MSSRYLEGNYGPVAVEQTLAELPVTGTLPDHLDGRYLRNGPNPMNADPATYHWFLGDGMVHGLRLRDGRAEWYRNRWVRSAAVAEALGEPVRQGPTHGGMDFAANTHVVGHAGRTFAIVEAGSRPYELTDELDTVGPCDFDGTLPGGYTAHPHRDPATGELHAVSYFWGWGNKVQYSVLGTDGRIRRTVDVEVTGSPMMHDFSLTESRVVLYDLPVTFDMEKAGAGTLPYTWDPDHPARVGVMSRDGDGTDVRWFDVEPCYVYHPLNAYDDGERLVLDVVRHPKTFATRHDGPDEGGTTLERWTVDPAAGKVIEERLHDRSQEFPRVDDRVAARPHRYGWSVGFETVDDRIAADTVYKHDLTRRTTEAHAFPGGGRPDEFVFVPRSADAAEDDGVLMGFVYQPADDRSDLVLLDAATLDPVAAVHLPTRVPHGFHGSWIPTP
jgi:carotenoid cleavage dioxygenase